jgi:hypothetical protein
VQQAETQRDRRIYIGVAIVVVTIAASSATLWGWALRTIRHTEMRAVRAKNLRLLHGSLFYYADEHGHVPLAHTKDDEGKPLQSWRVLLLPHLGQTAAFSQVDLEQPWDSAENLRILNPMPAYYRSPQQTAANSTTTDYFAVVGPHAPWWSERLKPWGDGREDEVLLIEVTGLNLPWTKPWDPTVDELLDMLRPVGGNGDSVAEEIMYVTVSGDIRTLDKNADRESLRKVLLGLEQKKLY